MFNQKTLLKNILLPTTLAATLVPAIAMAEQWKFAVEEIPNSIMDAYAQEFKKRIESETNGDITVTIYHLGSLGTPTELVGLAADGVVQFANVSIGNLGTIVPESQIFLLPYTLPSDEEKLSRVLSESDVIYNELGNDFESKGLKLQTLYSEGSQVWTTNREIRTPEDFDNFKMRVMVSPILLEAYEDMGASPTPLDFGEVYGALQLGQVDGQVNPVPAIEEMKFYEVSDYMIWAGAGDLVTAVVSGSDWYESLAPERQQLINDTLQDMEGFIYDTVADYNKEKLENIKKNKPDIKLIKLSEEEQKAFKARTRDTYKAYTDITGKRGKKLLDDLNQEIDSMEK